MRKQNILLLILAALILAGFTATIFTVRQGGTGLSSCTTGDLLYGSATNTLSKLAVGSTGDNLTVVGGIPAWKSAANYTATPSDPTTPSGTSEAMFGFAGSITPKRTGNLFIVIVGNTSIFSSSIRTIDYKIRYGTGSAPANGDAATGTLAGSAIRASSQGNGSTTTNLPFTTTSVVAGLTVGTAYWIDLSQTQSNSFAFSTKNISISVIEQ